MNSEEEFKNLSIDTAIDLVRKALVCSDVSDENASCVALALVDAEADGQIGHGLSRVPSYAAGARSGKIKGKAVPELTGETVSMALVDAKFGFAYPAINLAIEMVTGKARESGIAMAVITHSHHFGVAGAHCEKLADSGFASFLFGNSPQAIAPWGGRKALFGTNPIAFAAPIKGKPSLVVDMALSKVARGKIMTAQKTGKPIPEGWALDGDGNPTTDPDSAMSGTMIPIGEAKGAALALMVEVMSAAISGAFFAFESSSLFTAEGHSPNLGQAIIAIDVGIASQGFFDERMLKLVDAIENEDGARLPGVSRLKNRENAKLNGLAVPMSVYREIEALLV